ncbi:anti-sigma factor domain-containing protein [Effusibacillus dendaii]|uniref:RsgI N-terminal anti-sigma domain-containing protein n=1 Tax=Effusibacillus dendaii TaxID=2743772 RepID=A0A7I8DGX1_9BACL|nr:anti-sigma factor domain-containing protein [Effusibacillus dendaii]BCJ88126.1 hypothetical protein skT53_31110 [Effusibacillus dendaii]
MRKSKGVIMKISGSHAIVMTADRQFVKIPVPSGIQLGEEIEFSVPGFSRSYLAWRRVAPLAAAFVLAIGLWQASEIVQAKRVSAYVALDINPSLELAINKEKSVLKTEPLNDDGKVLVADLHLEGKPVEQAIDELTDQATKKGFIKPDSEILVTASAAPDAQIDVGSLEQILMTRVSEKVSKSGLSANVGGVVVSEKVREEAKTVGLSSGKYAVYLQAQATGLPVSVEELKREAVTTVVKKHGDEIKQILEHMNGDRNLEDLLQEWKAKKEKRDSKEGHDTDQVKPSESGVGELPKWVPGNWNRSDDGQRGNHPRKNTSDDRGKSQSDSKNNSESGDQRTPDNSGDDKGTSKQENPVEKKWTNQEGERLNPKGDVGASSHRVGPPDNGAVDNKWQRDKGAHDKRQNDDTPDRSTDHGDKSDR